MAATNLELEKPIFSCICPEPKGPVHRYVYPMPLSPQNLAQFWEKASKFRVLFWDDIKGDFKRFAELFITRHGDELEANGLFWKIDDMVGLFYMTHIGKFDAQIHYSFFDRRVYGRHRITRMMIRYVFEEFGFKRLSAEIPCYIKHTTTDFIEQVGLKYEGRKRDAALFDNEWFDVKLYGILREEALKWEFTQEQ